MTSTIWRSVAAASCVSLGILHAAASGFLLYWNVGADGEHDIAARGGILLYMLMPPLLGASWMLLVVLVGPPLRRTGRSVPSILGISVLALLLSATLAFLPPFFLLWRVLYPVPDSVRAIADFLVAGGLIAGGLVVLWRAGRVRQAALDDGVVGASSLLPGVGEG